MLRIEFHVQDNTIFMCLFIYCLPFLPLFKKLRKATIILSLFLLGKVINRIHAYISKKKKKQPSTIEGGASTLQPLQ